MVSSDNPQNIPISIEDEMKSSFMDYAMSVIVARALPDARDGLKPVHRRILFAQQQVNNVWNRPYVKCARIVGDVLGKFHPHGDAATYDALVRMAQDFSMRYQLIDGQGNFGSVDGDPPAAYRYTECRMERLASEMLADIDKETVNWVPNYDEKELEPTVLPSRAPNLLLNGATGIAVGMATNIPPHNLNEIIDATMAMIKNPQITTRELLAIVPGPDFPTGGIIHGRRGIHLAYETGRGQIMVRGKTDFEEMKGGRTAIIVTEIPYQLNKKRWIEETADLVREKRLEGISDIRDESDRTGMRVVFELRKDAVPAIVLNNLFKMTALQSSFSVNMLAIVDGRPKVLTLAEALARFVEHRRNVVTRRCIFELREARLRREIVEGLGLAVMQIDRIIQIIRSSAEPEEAKTRLMAEPMKGLEGFLERAGRPANEVDVARAAGFYNLNDRQAQAILEMRLARLTGLEREKLEAEYRELWTTTDRLDALLADEGKLMGVITEELAALKTQYGDARRTQIIDVDAEISDEELIAHEEMIVTVTHNGYIKRTPVSEYRAQARGGRGVKGAESASDDFIAELFVAETHDHILMFTDKGRVYAKRVFETPLGKRDSKGKALVNFLELQEGEKVLTMLPVKKFDPGWFVFMATKSGTVKKTELDSFGNIRATGIRAIGLDDGDNLIAVKLTNGEMDVLLASKNGYAVHFQEDKVRPMGRDARGVRGMDLREGDSLIGMATFPRDAQQTLTILTVCEKGFGKRTPLAEYPTKNRGGMGVITIRTTERNGKVVAVRVVSNEDHLILITDRGKLIRVPVAGVSTVGRATQGVRIMRVDDGEKVSSVERLAEPEDQAGIEVATPVEVEAATEEELLEEGEAGDDESALPDDDEGSETWRCPGPRSQEPFTRAQAAIPGGVNSPVRAFRSVGGEPIFFARGAGARVWDVDEQDYLDYVGSWGPLVLGHAHPTVLAAIHEAAAKGTSFGAPTELEVRFAEHLCSVVPSMELVRCVSSGTEATMSAIRVARGFTGRDKIIKIDGGYHGHADCLLAEAGSGAATLGIPGSAGVPAGAARDTLVVPWNDLDAMRKRLAADDVAAVIVEPVCGNMGVVPPQPGYLEGLRDLCTTHGTVLIFDEVMTGFRVAHGGAQARFGIQPDLTCLGKIVGGGLPAACFGGRRDIMSKLAPLGPVYQAGTLSGNPLALAAGLATLELVAKPGTYERLEALGARLEAGLSAAAHAAGVPTTINRVGSMLTSFFSPDPVFDYASAKKCDTKRYGRFFSGMLAQGIYLAPSQFEAAFISLAHTDADIDLTIDAAKTVLKALA